MSNFGPYKSACRRMYETTEHFLYNFQRNKQAIEEFRAQCEGMCGRMDNEGIRGSEISDPTGRGGTALADPPANIKTAMDWERVILTAWEEMTAYDSDMARILEVFYGLNRKEGRPRKETEKVKRRLMNELNVSATTLYTRRRECVDWVQHLAEREGLIRWSIREE